MYDKEQVKSFQELVVEEDLSLLLLPGSDSTATSSQAPSIDLATRQKAVVTFCENMSQFNDKTTAFAAVRAMLSKEGEAAQEEKQPSDEFRYVSVKIFLAIIRIDNQQQPLLSFQQCSST